MLEINKRYIRVSPKCEASIVSIKTDKELEYQQSFIQEGFIFTEIVPSVAQ